MVDNVRYFYFCCYSDKWKKYQVEQGEWNANLHCMLLANCDLGQSLKVSRPWKWEGWTRSVISTVISLVRCHIGAERWELWVGFQLLFPSQDFCLPFHPFFCFSILDFSAWYFAANLHYSLPPLYRIPFKKWFYYNFLKMNSFSYTFILLEFLYASQILFVITVLWGRNRYYQ